MVYYDDVNILGCNVHTMKWSTEALVVASKETRLEINADRTEYTIMSRDQNAGRSQDIKVDTSTFERVEVFLYLGTALTIANSFQEEIKEQIVVKECLLSFGAEYFVFHFSIQIYKD